MKKMKKNLKVKRRRKRKILFHWVTKDLNLMVIVFLRSRSLITQQVRSTQQPLRWSYILLLEGGKAAVTLFVGNISYDVDTNTLTEFFTSQGFEPTSVRILEDSEGSSRG